MLTFDTGSAWLPPVAVATTVIGAAVLLVAERHLSPKVSTALAVLVAGAVTGICAVVLAKSAQGRLVTWSAGWEPHHGHSVGILLVSDPVGAGAALTAGALTVLALVYSWHYMSTVKSHYRALMLLFLGGMTGFAFTGDLFDMFVFFELMGASAYALTGLKVEDATAVEGGFNFGIVNSLGAYMSLMGLGILYARTGNLGLAQLRVAIGAHRADALLVTAFALVITGFLVKAAVTPFHFWLADAHAVAPPPVCVLFSGIMVPLGAYAVFRVYWVVFSGALPGRDVRFAFIFFGVLTAVVGAVMCLGQRHIKRLLAYSTIGHVGLFICSLGLLGTAGTAGAVVYIAGHAGVKAALFLLAGLLLARQGTVDEHHLYGSGVEAPRIVPVLWALGGLALAGLPPFGTALGKAISEEASAKAGFPWLVPVFILVSAATGGAVLRVTARTYFGLGPPPSEHAGRGPSEGEEQPEANFEGLPLSILTPICLLLVAALVLGILPSARSAAEHAAAFFTQPVGYTREAVQHFSVGAPAEKEHNWTALGLGYGFLSAILAVMVAAAGLYSQVIAERAGRARRAGAAALSGLRALHSGHIGDYVAWLFVGVASVLVMVAVPALGR